jgi:hypothetical protein
VKLPADPRARTALLLVAGLVAFALVMEVIARLTPEPKGPPSSSYATTPAGLAAYASVLERAGHPVRQVRTPIAEREPRSGETLIVLDPDVLDSDEAEAIGAWVQAGGRLVAGGDDERWLDEVMDQVPEWRDSAGSRRIPLVPVAETVGVREVRGEGGAWAALGGTLPVIGPADAPLLVTARSGDGTVALIADPSVLQNARLGQADNAALGLALAGGAERPVAFLETVHGYGVSTGFGGLPTQVKWVLLGLFLTSLVALWSVGRRFGPTEDPETEPPPPRMEYVDALASALARTKPEKSKEHRS